MCPTGLCCLMKDGEGLRRGAAERGKSPHSPAPHTLHLRSHTQTSCENNHAYSLARTHTHKDTGCIICPCDAASGIQPQHPPPNPPPPAKCGRAMVNGFWRGRDLKLSWFPVCSRRPHLRALMVCSQGSFVDFGGDTTAGALQPVRRDTGFSFSL